MRSASVPLLVRRAARPRARAGPRANRGRASRAAPRSGRADDGCVPLRQVTRRQAGGRQALRDLAHRLRARSTDQPGARARPSRSGRASAPGDGRAASHEDHQDSTKCPTHTAIPADARRVRSARDIAEFGIADHGREREARGPDLPKQRQRVAPLFVKPHGRGNAGRLPLAPAVNHASGRYSAVPRNHARTARPERDGGRHLAVGDLAEGATGTDARRPPSAAPVWESWSRPESARPRRSGITARKRRHTCVASHGACVMKC